MRKLFRQSSACIIAFCLSFSGTSVSAANETAQVTAFKQAVAESISTNSGIAEFYRSNGYQPVWTGNGPEFAARRAALFDAVSRADVHGLPAGKYRADALLQQMRDANSVRDLGLVEAELSRVFVIFARDLQSGLLDPSRVDTGIAREIPRLSPADQLSGLVASDATAFFRSIAPQSRQYLALLKHKIALEALMEQGGWGLDVPVAKMEPGDSGPNVVALRNRLVAMGYLRPTASPRYDDALREAVQKFQAAHGLETDGIAGQGTLTELNRPVSERLQAVIVALERERWMPRERGERHVLVNQTDFSASIVDQGHVSFQTRAVIGKNTSDRRSPEFSDQMEHMVINPSWYVPRSIVTKEYLPKLRANPHAVSHIEITDRQGRRVNRGAVNFSQFSSRSFPFSMRQPPGKSNALGLVKFMFPNKHNVYMHDTPQKDLFSREVRDFSHGCIRLADPFGFAYAILARQEENPKDYFHRVLDTGRETTVRLKKPIPVHLIYRTAFIGPKGEVEYRRDIYGRDQKIWEELNKAGVVLPSVQG
ncbi:murein L,D-transpeptidase [Ruegeria sediminis]|uniref:Murein L,D-transpeptidase n=1 Tax=Ruegeria sediminis TaxID=2583820 RepID=A0ABY2X1H9_9RHOB|nr:L,D-transpeptidase family protein [Ruegeria sediminis]TMV08536.1 murein L,D-transpeptidase [Ruegeria sediminis]